MNTETTDIYVDIHERAATICELIASNPELGEQEAATLLGYEEDDPATDFAIDAWATVATELDPENLFYDELRVVSAEAAALIRDGEITPEPLLECEGVPFYAETVE